MNLIHGDCLEILPTLDADSIDSCVTDPPYGLSFMGKDWDHGVPGEKGREHIGTGPGIVGLGKYHENSITQG